MNIEESLNKLQILKPNYYLQYKQVYDLLINLLKTDDRFNQLLPIFTLKLQLVLENISKSDESILSLQNTITNLYNESIEKYLNDIDFTRRNDEMRRNDEYPWMYYVKHIDIDELKYGNDKLENLYILSKNLNLIVKLVLRNVKNLRLSSIDPENITSEYIQLKENLITDKDQALVDVKSIYPILNKLIFTTISNNQLKLLKIILGEKYKITNNIKTDELLKYISYSIKSIINKGSKYADEIINTSVEIIIDIINKIKNIDELKVASTFINKDDLINIHNNEQDIYTFIKIRADDIKNINPRFSITMDENRQIMYLQYAKKLTTFTDNFIFGPFTYIYTPSENNNYIINENDKFNPLINKIENQQNVCIVGYGASGAGKTSSLVYLDTPTKKENGILIHLCNKIKGYNRLYVSFIEIQSNDILRTNETEFNRLDTEWVNEHNNLLGSFVIDQMSSRSTHTTPNNPQSSRSHFIIFIRFSKEDIQDPYLIICDFAGVENKFDCDSKFDDFNVNGYKDEYKHKLESIPKEQIIINKIKSPYEFKTPLSILSQQNADDLFKKDMKINNYLKYKIEKDDKNKDKIKEFVKYLNQVKINNEQFTNKDKMKNKILKEICQDRVKEGEFINNSLLELRHFISYFVSKNKIPKFVDICAPIQCNPYYNDCFGSTSQPLLEPKSIIINEIKHKLCSKECKLQQCDNCNHFNNLTFCIFNVINISFDSNPPSIQYVDTSDLLREMYRLESIKDISQHNPQIADERLDDNVLDVYLDKINNKLVNKIKKETKFEIKLLLLKELIEIINNENAVSLVGTLEFTDMISKYALNKIVCNFKYDEEELKRIKDYQDSELQNYKNWISTLSKRYNNSIY